MSKQTSIASFFTKSPAASKIKKEESPKRNMKLKGNEVQLLDLVWAKLEGHPWWPALVCDSPGEETFTRKNLVHVQFFDRPPTHGWVKDGFVKPYCLAGEGGVPTYKDKTWKEAVKEANEARQLSRDDRLLLLVDMIPSDDEIFMDVEDGDDNSDKSKENVAVNGQNGHAAGGQGSKDEPKTKKRKLILYSDSESEDDYKPEKDVDALESDDDSVSSGVDEAQLSGPETESEVDSPVKNPKSKRRKPEPLKCRNLNTSLSSSPSMPSSTPKVSEGTKSKLALFAAKEAPASDPAAEDDDWPFLSLPWLKPENIKDRAGRRPDHPEYDPRTLYVPDSFLNQQTPGMRQWWELKSRHYDTVLFFKMGKFYELFHMDAVLGVQELGLIMMKGDKAHSGFPEVAYSRYSTTLIEKGYKVARIEQTETPEMMEKRCKKMARPTKFDRVVRREVCQVTSRATRVYGCLDGEETEAATAHLLAISERPARGGGDNSEFGVAFVDTSTGTFHLGQFVDDRHSSRLCTLLAHYPVAQILLERGHLSAKTQQVVNAVVPPGLREVLVPEKEFWAASKTLGFLAEGPYFQEDGEAGPQWPQPLKDMIDEGDALGKTPQEGSELALSALGALTWYLMDCHLEEQLLTRRKFQLYTPPDSKAREEAVTTTNTPAFITNRHHMVLDGTTLHNLEVFQNSVGGTEGTLIERLDHCCTPFGKRLLRNWICGPLCSPGAIRKRLDAITDLRNHPDLLDEVMPLLKTLPDLERTMAKVHTQGLNRQSSHPDTRAIYFEEVKYNKKKVQEFLSALKGFKTCMEIIKLFKGVKDLLSSRLLQGCITTTKEEGKFPLLDEPLKFFDNAFDHAEAQKEGKIMPHCGVDKEYDEALEQISTTKQRLADYLKEQNKYFGVKVVYWGNDKKRYQLEVPEHACRHAGEEYELISQKKGHRRFWTPTTKELLADMIAGEENRNTSLTDIARRIFNQFDQHQKLWEAAVQCVATLDVLCSLTLYSREVDTVRPEVITLQQDNQPFLEIRDGLHPCLLTTLSGEDFIPNDVVVGGEGEDAHCPLVLVTGPNMGGKSTLMRQTALICLLAQLGSYVPASSCRLTPVDRIFTRLGASDRIMAGESTFFVELAETSSILQHSTCHSLVLVDELGRGTATYDGTAIASGVVDALTHLGCRTLFSTHYHSLVDDFSDNKSVSLGHMACMVEGENEEDPSQETITFLYKFAGGSCPKSYGFNAARLADLPDPIIRQGSHKAKQLEKISLKKQIFFNVFGTAGRTFNTLRDALRSLRSLE